MPVTYTLAPIRQPQFITDAQTGKPVMTPDWIRWFISMDGLFAGGGTLATGSITTTGNLTVGGKFGCNGKAAQGPVLSDGTLATVIATLIANGIMQ